MGCNIMETVNHKVRTFKENITETGLSSYVLGADVGGTNTKIGIAGVKDSKPVLLFSLDFKSQELDSIVPAINETLDYADKNYNIKVDSACFGIAGAIHHNRDTINLTNLDWDINKNKIKMETELDNISIINDFQSIGYGLNLLDQNNENDILSVRDENIQVNHSSTKAILGAGTGLGKSIVVYDKQYNSYIPLPSEGGHEDFPVHNDFEIKLLDFIKNLRGISQPITYEELLSGRGIENIYTFLITTQQSPPTEFTKEIEQATDKTPLISKYKEIDETCRETFRLFTKFYARCAKNFVLNTMATGGLYISGGVALKNKEIFGAREFVEEFENAYRREDILKKVPIYIIVNSDVSLLGACLAAITAVNEELK